MRPLWGLANVPRKTFLLMVSEEERLRRLWERGADKNDIDNLVINNRVLFGFRKWSRKLNHLVVEVDTSEMSPEEVTKTICGLIDD